MASGLSISLPIGVLQAIAVAVAGISLACAQATPGQPAPPGAMEQSPSAGPPTLIDDGLWDAIQDNDNPKVFEEYLRQYPGSRHREQAAGRLAGLRKAGRPAATGNPGPTAGAAAASDPETAMWKVVFESDSSGGYEAFLKHYPQGKYATVAARRLKAARENDRWKAESGEEGAWQTAESTRTADGYRAYLESHPQGRHAALARQQEARLRAGASEAEESRLWLAADKGGISQLDDYLRSFPDGRHAAAAHARRDQLRKVEADMSSGRIVKDCPGCPDMVVLPAGSFQMGESNEKPTRIVSIARPFAMAKTEVTQAQWRAVMGTEPGKRSPCGDCPIDGISWNDAQLYVEKLGRMTGKLYRLPSEAEWEYACRAGGRHEYCGGNDAGQLAWHGAIIGSGNSEGMIHPVGQKQANAFGLHDMSGNVAEWVEDCYHARLKDGPIDGSAWTIAESPGARPGNADSGAKGKGKGSGAKTRGQEVSARPAAEECSERVLRGGSWLSWPQYIRAAHRVAVSPGSRSSSYGIRPVWSHR